ncbi:MAG TPA: pilus assembly protein TadG-related protein [Bryobacteraceae bacterium]|nr:pilus assembly protein TadG-related protein [Bryobacteraceae bacterium]
MKTMARIYKHDTKPRRGERGVSLMLFAVCLVGMLGALGLAYDMGRMFITKSELQTFCDASVLAAVHQLDGTQAGIQGANTTATAGPLGTTKPNGYNFDTVAINTAAATYATSLNGTQATYATANASGANNYRFITLTATANVPISFLRLLPGIGASYTVTANATAGSQAISSATSGGLEPFVPDAHNTADTQNWGFTPGTEYTLKWGNSSGNGKGKGNGAATTCAGDVGWTDPNPASQHGFADLGQGNGNSSLSGVIVYGGYPNASSTPSSVYAGMSLSGVPGNRGTSIFDALNERASQDTDDVSATYAAYIAGGTGNGRRIVTMPVGDPNSWSGNGNGSETVVGFANFFLDPAYSGSSGAICATYIGPANMNGFSGGGSDGTQIYYNVLFK